MVELLPCPFCGSTDPMSYQDEWGCAYVECQGCDCQGPLISHMKGLNEADHLEAARIAWNRRAHTLFGLPIVEVDEDLGDASQIVLGPPLI